MNVRTTETNPLDEAYIDWLTRVTHRACIPQENRDLMEMSFFAGAAMSFNVAEVHGAEVVLAALKTHIVRLQAMGERYPGPIRDWRERFHKRIDDQAMQARVYITWKAREIRRQLGLPERP